MIIFAKKQNCCQWEYGTDCFKFCMNSLCLSDHLPCANIILPTIFLYLNLRESFGYIVLCLYFVQMHHVGIKTACVFSSVQLLSCVQHFVTPMDCSTPGFPVHHYLPEFAQPMSIELMMPFNHLILCCPLLFLPSIFPSIRVFSNELALCIRWPKSWSFSFSISPFN